MGTRYLSVFGGEIFCIFELACFRNVVKIHTLSHGEYILRSPVNLMILLAEREDTDQSDLSILCLHRFSRYIFFLCATQLENRMRVAFCIHLESVNGNL